MTDSPKGNRILAALSSDDYFSLLGQLEYSQLQVGEVLYNAGDRQRYIHFPTSGIVSLDFATEDGFSAQLAIVGNDGLIGLPMILGGKTTTHRAIVQSAGSEFRLRADRAFCELGKGRYLNVEIVLSHQQITWIEEQRSGGSFEAKLRICLQVQMDSGVSEVTGEIPIEVADTKWREHILPGLGFGSVFIVELPAIGLQTCEALSHSYQALRKGQTQFARGAYDDAAGSCRIALDPFFEMVKKDDSDGKLIPKLKASI